MYHHIQEQSIIYYSDSNKALYYCDVGLSYALVVVNEQWKERRAVTVELCSIHVCFQPALDSVPALNATGRE